MAINLINLFPPIVADTMPAFIRTKTCRVYFSLSIYNSKSDIKNVQVSLINQKNNMSALKTDLYPSGIKIANLYQDPNQVGDYKYYIEIPTSDLINGKFDLNQFYKVQLRFTSTLVPYDPPSNGTGLATWLYTYMDYFSEWSKVCLVKGIEQPIIRLRNFDDTTAEEQGDVTFNSAAIQIVGNLTYPSNVEEKEYLKSYHIKIYQANDTSKVVVESEEVYTNPYNPNQINYQLKYDLSSWQRYTMELTYTTINLYTQTLYYNFFVVQQGEDKLKADIITTADEDNGRIKVSIVSKDMTKFIGNFTIRRSSAQSDFHKWEDIKNVSFSTGSELNYTWYDTTIQSGVWYKYCAQKRNAAGNRGAIIQTDTPIMCVFDDMFLTRDNCQLKIQFNPSLNEFKYNVTEAQQTTIGSKYPYVTRNGNNYFRTFPIGGLISSFIDTTDWYDPHFYDGNFHSDEDQNEIRAFTSKNAIYGNAKQLYENYNNRKGIDEYNDYIYEREFRNKVYDFLYKHDIKLFRSTTEGNILIKLMNIDFQPIESLGRRLYSFTATAVEVDEPSISNYNKYGIQVIGNYENTAASYQKKILGQIQGTFDSTDGNLLNTKIKNKHEKAVSKGFINSVKDLKWLRLEIAYDPNLPETHPYVIVDNGNSLVKATNSSTITAGNSTVGFIVIINGKEIVVYPRMERRPIGNPGDASNPMKGYPTTETQLVHVGILELKEPNTSITDLRFKYKTTATIDYIATISEREDASISVRRTYYSRKIGQIYGTFKVEDSIMQKIYNKYLFKSKSYYEKLLDVPDIRIQATPGAVVYVKDSKDKDLNRHILENGYLQLRDEDALIEGLYFCGVHLYECKDPLFVVNGLTEKDFVFQGGYNSLDEIQNPVNGGVYAILSYGLKSGASLENHKILITDEDHVEYRTVTPNTFYTLILEPIEDDVRLHFVYYYGCWYLLNDSYEKTKLLKGDIRHVRDDEFIFIEHHYNSFDQITNPIKNGVYWVGEEIGQYAVDLNNIDIPSSLNPDQNGLLTVDNDSVIRLSAINAADRKYALIVERYHDDTKNRYIYYHDTWYPFTKNNDVLCPVDGLVDYTCQIVKGVY